MVVKNTKKSESKSRDGNKKSSAGRRVSRGIDVEESKKLMNKATEDVIKDLDFHFPILQQLCPNLFPLYPQSVYPPYYYPPYGYPQQPIHHGPVHVTTRKPTKPPVITKKPIKPLDVTTVKPTKAPRVTTKPSTTSPPTQPTTTESESVDSITTQSESVDPITTQQPQDESTVDPQQEPQTDESVTDTLIIVNPLSQPGSE